MSWKARVAFSGRAPSQFTSGSPFPRSCPYVVACGIAAIIAIVEQYNRLGARFTLVNQAWIWWTARVVLEIAIGAFAVGLLRAMKIEGWDQLWGWAIAGASGPAIARLRVLDFGKGDDARPFGIAAAYERVRAFIEARIDRCSAQRQAV